MGRSWPSQNIQPAGAKLPANILISPTYGIRVLLLILRREDAYQGDAEGQRKEGLAVLVRLAPADVADRVGQERGQVRHAGVDARRAREDAPDGDNRVAVVAGAEHGVCVRRHLALRYRVEVLAAGLGEVEATAHADGDARAQIGQREGGLAVAAVVGAQQRE